MRKIQKLIKIHLMYYKRKIESVFAITKKLELRTYGFFF